LFFIIAVALLIYSVPATALLRNSASLYAGLALDAFTTTGGIHPLGSTCTTWYTFACPLAVGLITQPDTNAAARTLAELPFIPA